MQSRTIAAFSTIVAFGVLSLIATANADVKLPAIFSDHMILQQEMPLSVWGTASAGEKVSVSFADQIVSAQADANGKWTLKLNPLRADSRPRDFIVRGSNILTIKDVLTGEVWFSSGQSNMAMNLKAADRAEEEIAAANYLDIRWFMTAAVNSGKPLADTDGKWMTCSPATAADFSACAYFFARDLHQSLKQPVGMVHAAWGGSMVEWWIREETLKATPQAQPILDQWARVMSDWPQRKAKFDKAMEDWTRTAASLNEEGVKPPKQPDIGPWHPGSLFQPSNLYNGMVSPVVPFAIRGVIWYQGESNSDRPYQYRALLPALIRDWRSVWNQGDFPFLIVQLPNFMASKPQPSESNWALTREAQLMTANAVPHTAIAVTIDIGEAANIHPKNKREVGRRLGLVALNEVYKHSVKSSGPLFEHAQVEGPAMRVFFTYADGLGAKQGAAKGFAIAGEDRHFVWADARIEKDSVLVSSATVSNPVAVRYAWADNPECNLVNDSGLPASPFRTDDWRSRPVFKEMKPNRYNVKQLRLSFADVGEGGFVDQPITGFLVAGADKIFHPAKTQFFGGDLLVWNEQVTQPVAVRYAWPGSATENNQTLRGESGMTVAPFRTDTWEDGTYAK